jgi:hypothetical protein
LGAPFGVSTSCGDAIVGDNEECDDGDDGSDACTAHCQTRDQSSVASERGSDRYLGIGRHPVAGLDSGFITTFMQVANVAASQGEGGQAGMGAIDDSAKVGATLFDVWGRKQHHVEVSEGAFPIDDANPVAAALPGGHYAVAWSDFDGDGSDLGIALRLVNGDGTLGSRISANAQREFSQRNPDVLWTGSQLVVAWEDYSDAFTGPDLRYRVFDENLRSTSPELTLANGDQLEGAVSLALFNGGWAAAYREEALEEFAGSGRESIVVRVGEAKFRIGRYFGGPMADRPALAQLDSTHLLVVFTEGTDLGQQAGVLNTPRLRYAVVDTAGPTSVLSSSLDPLDDVYELDFTVSQTSPAAVAGPDGVYLSWRSEARPGDAAGDQIWLKYVGWQPTLPNQIDLREPEMLAPRTADGSFGNQRTPALAYVPASTLPPAGGLAIGWDDYAHTQGPNAGDPDVVVHYAPLRARPTTSPRLETQEWTATTGAAWPTNWSVLATTSAQVTINANGGRILASGAAASAVGYPSNHTALDVDMVTKVTWNLNQATGGLVARLADSDSDTYLVATFNPMANDTWRIYGLLDGVPQVPPTAPLIASAAQPFLFVTYAQELQFFMRFRVKNNAAGDIDVAAKLWLTDLPEPAAWTLQGTVLASSTLGARLANRAGHFGVVGGGAQSGRSATFDDFRAVFYEGVNHGDPSAPPPTSALARAPALYRGCTATSPCSVGNGTCELDSDCMVDATCQLSQSERFGIGSGAGSCTPAHCEDNIRNFDEPRVDCGGADCGPCTCALALANGATGYCTTTSNCLCGIGEGLCSFTNQCKPGLVCKGAGLQYGVASGATVCAPYHCMNRTLDSTAGETGIDCGGECGSCACGVDNGSALHCRAYCPCPSGHGTCRWNDECQAGLICGSTKTGSRFGLGASTQACVKAHCDNNVLEPALGETAKDCGGECGTCP